MPAPSQTIRAASERDRETNNRQNTVVLLGSSVRAAAQSAALGGFQVIGIDQFGDRDARESCVEFSTMDQVGACRSLLDRYPDTSIVQVGGLSNLDSWLDAVGVANSRLEPVRTIERHVCEPAFLASIAERSGLRFPATIAAASAHQKSNDGDERWLIKPARGAGGLAIRWHDRQSDQTDLMDPDRFWIQRWIEGRCFGATLVIRDDRVELLGICRSLFHSIRVQANDGGSRRYPFVYAGSVGPIRFPRHWTMPLVDLVGEVASATGLKGLCNVDFVADRDGTLWLLEINPRWSGSSEIIERAMYHDGKLGPGHSLFTYSQTKSTDRSADTECLSCTPGSAERSGYFAVKKVVFATQSIRFNLASIAAQIDPRVQIADIPREGTAIQRGAPICSLILRCDAIDGLSPASIRPLVRSIQRG